MKPRLLIWAMLTLLVINFACKKDIQFPDNSVTTTTTTTEPSSEKSIYANFPETFESGSKGAYAAANVTLSTGTWNLDDALIGSSASDRKNGSKAVRMQNTGKINMQFNVTSGSSIVTIYHGVYGADASSTWGLWYSTDGGSNWTQTGSNMSTTSTTLSQAVFTLSVSGNIRFELRKLSGGRLNIDDFSVTDNTTESASRDDNLAMGNPSGAATSDSNNYILIKDLFALAYNNSRGSANWVSWHLSTDWKGTAERCDCFTQDHDLPTGFYKAATSHYTNTGFDRGHMCPSEDRDETDEENAITFKMTNIMPQAPNLNQQTWKYLEDYCRTLINNGNELYIISGGYGSGGTGSSGGTTYTIHSGDITVPSYCWKVIVVLPIGTNDLARLNVGTRVIAVIMPNLQTVNSQPWGYYRTTVDAIESATGYDILSNAPGLIQSVIEAVTDSGPTS
jgi:endonuclease G, mitochondrial